MSTKEDICIIIPIYKEILCESEIISIKQCATILSDYSICFICYRDLNINFYLKVFNEIRNYKFFEKHYFEDVNGYNRLLLSASFYVSFLDYKYILIYQTDCYVFKDELLAWANKDYDYIGGLWFEGFDGDPYTGAKYWRAGNGGLSLRKTETMVQVLTSNKPLKNFKQLYIEKRKLYKVDKLKGLKEFFLLPLNLLGFQNNCKKYVQEFKHNEDIFFVHIHTVFKLLKIPKVEEALFFSWDRCPRFLFENLGSLPFACHAWFREDGYYKGNRSFWSSQIDPNIKIE